VTLGGPDAVFGAAAVNPVVSVVATLRLEERRERDEVDGRVLTGESILD
jgi:hypothetical protein